MTSPSSRRRQEPALLDALAFYAAFWGEDTDLPWTDREVGSDDLSLRTVRVALGGHPAVSP